MAGITVILGMSSGKERILTGQGETGIQKGFISAEKAVCKCFNTGFCHGGGKMVTYGQFQVSEQQGRRCLA